MTDNQIEEDPNVAKNKQPVAGNKTHFVKNYFKRKSHSKSVLVPKQTGIQLKSGAVFCLPAKSSHSSRIIIPNKRFLEDDYQKVEISPKKPKVEHLSADVKKSSTVTIPSTYRYSVSTRKRFKSDSGDTATSVSCKQDVDEDGQCETGETKHHASDVHKQDLTLGSKNSEPESVTTQAVEKDSPKITPATESSENVSLTTVSAVAMATGSILQKPKLCLDQTALDRSKLAFAKSLRNQMTQESQSELSDTAYVGNAACSTSATASVTSPVVHSANTSVHSSNDTPSLTCSSSNSRTG